ncbi:hypothetical protein [Pedobacter cryotolerans]|uniref:DUF4412 domain-containing protein n=1 Tax=Pedobacter cryotolerans TaxID=2571270 RepID=A0A4U1C821_9SPHI|nr:hypothetical protein [Pedobacter cryotolerans]TKC02492.1 hypothetical protein FA045_04235 [Pedobacter cryotolerans]
MFKSVKTGVLAAILISTAIFANAQKKISEGTVTYAVEYAPTAEQEGMVGMLPTEQKVKFNGNLINMVMEQGPATITVFSDLATQLGLVLIDVPVAQMQFAVKQTKADYDKQRATAPKFSEFKATGEKKMIGAYNTEKYTYKDDKGAAYELWATTDVELPAGFAGEDFKGVKGAVIKFTNFQQGLKQTLTVKEIKEEKTGPFNLDVPKGYEVKTMEEIMAMQGGGE